MNKHIHGISERQTDSAPSFLELWNNELKGIFFGQDIVAHNAPFEKSVLKALADTYEIDIPTDRIYDTLLLSRCSLDIVNYQLDSVCNALGIRFANHHHAKADAIGCAEIVLSLAEKNHIDSIEELFRESYCGRTHIKSRREIGAHSLECEYIANEDAITGKLFCFTGKLSYIQRDIAQVVIEKAGGVFKKGISSKVNYLVVGDFSELGDEYESGKLKKVKEYRSKGYNIEILTEEQFQEMVIYEGPKITKEMIDVNSNDFLDANMANVLYGKGVCVSEGFDTDFMARLSLLGVQMGPTHYEDEALQTDFFILSNSVLKDLFENDTKSPTVLRMESAMKKQLEPDEENGYHRLKCINEDTIREFLKRRAIFEQEVRDGIEPKSMFLK